MTSDAPTTASPWWPDADVLAAVATTPEPDADIVVLPFRVESDGTGVYRDVHLTTVKELRAVGVRARYLNDEAAHRTFQSEHSRDVYAALAMWVLSSASWDSLKAVGQYIVAWGRHVTGGVAGREIRISISRLTRPDGTVLEGVEVTGPPTDVATRVLSEISKMLDT
jgi:hypothetical protein